MSSPRTSGQKTLLGFAISLVLAAPPLGAAAPLAATTVTPAQLDLAWIAATLREQGAVEIDVPGELTLSGDWPLPPGTISIHAGGGVVADDWHLSSPGSTLTLDGPAVRLRGDTSLNVAQPAGQGGNVALLSGDGIVDVGLGASIDASGAAGQGGHIRLAANDVRARGALLALGRGLVEVDAKRGLRFLSRTDTGGGLVRLDPNNLTIGTTTSDVSTAGGSEIFPNSPPLDGQLDASYLAGTLLASNDVIVHTTNDVTSSAGLHPATSPIALDSVNGDISVESPIIWSNEHSLTLLAQDDLIILANVQNGDTGNVVGVSGWGGGSIGDGTYGALGGDTFILGTANATVANGVAFGSRKGTTEIWAYDLTLRGSTAAQGTAGVNNDGYAMIGYRITDGTSASGPIQVNAHDVSLLGGDNADDSERFAQIGHGGVLRQVTPPSQPPRLYTPGTTQLDLGGAITVRATGALLLDDGINYSYAQIGHGGLMFEAQRNNLSGDIDVSAASVTIKADFFAPGRPSGYAQIGHGGSLHSGFGVQSTTGDIDGAITVASTGSITLTAGTRNSSAAQIGHGGSGDWSGTGTTGSVAGKIGSHVVGGAPIVVTATNDITLNHVVGVGIDGTSQIGHGGPIFYTSNFGSILGNITVQSTAGNVSLIGGGNCPGGCGTQIGHGSLLESLFNVDAGADQGDIIVTAGAAGTVEVIGGGVTNGGGQYEWSQIGHGGPLLGFQVANGGVPNQHLNWGGAPAAGVDANDVTVTGAHVLVQGGKGASAAAQIGNGGFIYQYDGSGTMSVGKLDGKVTITTTTGDLQVLAGTDPGGNDVAYGTASAQIGNGGQNFSNPLGVPNVTEGGASGAVTITVAQESSLTNDTVGGSTWWLGHRTRGPLTGASVRLDTGTLDFVAGNSGGTTATISDSTFWSRFVAPPTLTGPEKANAEGGEVTLRIHGTSGVNGDLISNQPLTVPLPAPLGIMNAVHALSTADLTLNSPVTNNSAVVSPPTPAVDVDFVADDAFPAWSAMGPGLLTLGASGGPVGPVRLFAVSPTQFFNLTTSPSYVPPAQSFGVWYHNHGVAVVGVNFKLAPADLAITKTDGVTTAAPGGSVIYTITASNAGPANATGATVADTFPASLTCAWTCAGAGGGTCTASGSGNLNDAVNLPAGGSVTYTATCSISVGASGTLSNTATVVAPADVTDPTPGNNSATDSDTLALVSGYFTLTPCRLVDTRNANGPFGGPSFPAGATRSFTAGGSCGIPTDAVAVSFNITVTQGTAAGGLEIYRTGTAAPGFATIDYRSNQTRADNGLVRLGSGGVFDVKSDQATGTVEVIIDVNGYFK